MAPAGAASFAEKDSLVTLQMDSYGSSIKDGCGLCWFCPALPNLCSKFSPSSTHLQLPSLIATVGVKLLYISSGLFHQFVCRESNGLSADRAADVIPVVLRQSTSLTSTPPLRP